MSLTRVDQSSVRSSSSRRSSLVVNLSTTSSSSSKKRSSIISTSLLTSSSSTLGSKSIKSSSEKYFSAASSRGASRPASSIGDSFNRSLEDEDEEEGEEESAQRGSPTIVDVEVVGPQSAPPSLSKPFYGSAKSLCKDMDDDSNNRATNLQVTEVINETDTSNNGSDHNNKEASPEPIVEVRHTSSSSSSSSDSAPTDDDKSGGTKLVRRRTIKRYHRTLEAPQGGTNETTTEFTVQINRNNGDCGGKEALKEQTQQFRTRPLGTYYAGCSDNKETAAGALVSSTSAQLSSSSSSSKIAKCITTTTHNRSTSSSSSSHLVQHHHHHQSSSKVPASASMRARDNSRSPVGRTLDLRLGNSSAKCLGAESHLHLFEPVKGPVNREQEETTSSLRRSVEVEEEAELASISRRSRFNSSLGSAATTSTSTSSSTLRHQAAHMTSSGGRDINLRNKTATSISSSSASSSLFVNSTNNGGARLETSNDFLPGAESIFSSPDVRSLVKEIGIHFAQLENFTSTSHHQHQLHHHNNKVAALSTRLFGRRPLSPLGAPQVESKSSLAAIESGESGAKIRELLHKVQGHNTSATSSQNEPNKIVSLREALEDTDRLKQKSSDTKEKEQQVELVKTSRVVIEQIDHHMSDLCKKFQNCQDTQEAIDLLKVMIQMIERAWSVRVCGDDLGFKLCNSLRKAGGLDIILGFIQDADNELEDEESAEEVASVATPGQWPLDEVQVQVEGKKPLRLNLSKLQLNGTHQTTSPPLSSASPQVNKKPLFGQPKASSQAKDSDSDLGVTSDLGLDSTSFESLSCGPTGDETKKTTEEEQEQVNEKETRLKKEELVFLSARLLSQCLTSENRNYIAKDGLQSVVKLACRFTTMRSSQSQRIISMRSSGLKRQLSAGQLQRQPEQKSATHKGGKESSKPNSQEEEEEVVQEEHSDMHATVGTEILQHLFKHSEDTCSRIISLGGLEAILYGCRSSNLETLRHCASALANLALYGGPDSQQTMVVEKAHVWLFPLAFNEDDNVQYYACLAIVVLAANPEIEADVLKSSTLNLVEPFVTGHEPQRFAESTTSHIHGQSSQWLKRLVPVLESRREEARNLACFHFAMEAHIKREQGQTQVFREIGAVDALRRVGSSPIAIASKFACQALRLIGEKEPHKLSQQIPLWTSDDVAEWVSQIGFQRFRPAFVESRVDGDLLLQLDDAMLRSDIGIENGIVRRRFLRELSYLKRIADYTSVDRTGLVALLVSAGLQHDLLQYIYPMLQLGVARDNLHLLDCDQLMAECRVHNTMHRLKLSQAIRSLQERMTQISLLECANACTFDLQKSLDVFVSYRRSTGSQLASLLKVHLQLRGFSVFIDVERLEAGKFDNNLLDSIKTARNFILVLSPNALDRCIGDHQCKDWVHKEIVAALNSNCNIIPIMDNFHWPEPEQLPEDMRSITYFNGVRWIHDYQDACVDKVERFIRGELSNGGSALAASVQAGQSSAAPGSSQSSLQRNQPAPASHYSSTPSIVATPSLANFPATSAASQASASADFHPLAANWISSPNPTGFGSHSQHHFGQAAASSPRLR